MANPTSSKADASHQYRVSFREDVKPPQDEVATNGGALEGLSTRATTAMDGLSTRSALSSHSSDDGSHPSSSSNKKYSKLRSSLTREQTNRDPLVFYQVTRHLGSGSMGDVKLVKKRHIGGSARKNVQQAVQRHQQAIKCLNTPVIGNLFQFCVDGRLVVNDKADPADSRHSIGSYFGKKEDLTVSTTTEESNDNTSSSSSSSSTDVIIYAMKSIHLDQLTNPQIVDELRNEVAILKSLDHPNIVRAMDPHQHSFRPCSHAFPQHCASRFEIRKCSLCHGLAPLRCQIDRFWFVQSLCRYQTHRGFGHDLYHGTGSTLGTTHHQSRYVVCGYVLHTLSPGLATR
jgi:serine/threonine protein kinase